MEGRLSMEKAKKIKEKREFEEEMRAIGADVPPESDDEDGKSRGRRAKNAGRNKAVESTSGDEDGDEDDDEDDQPAPPKKVNRDCKRRPKIIAADIGLHPPLFLTNQPDEILCFPRCLCSRIEL